MSGQSWLKGTTSNLKVKKKSGEMARPRSSDEYEESDEEPAQELPELYLVDKIVDHRTFKKDEAYKLVKTLTHNFEVHAMERSHFLCSFRVHWKGYPSEEDSWEPIENFNTGMAKKIKKYCKKRNVDLPKDFEKWLMPIETLEGHVAVSSCDSDDEIPTTTKRGASADRSRKAPTPVTPRTTKKEAEKNRLSLLRNDLALSPSPGPMPTERATTADKEKEKEKSFDPLFDYSDDDVIMTKRKPAVKKTKKAPATKSPLAQKRTPIRKKKAVVIKEEPSDNQEKLMKKKEIAIKEEPIDKEENTANKKKVIVIKEEPSDKNEKPRKKKIIEDSSDEEEEKPKITIKAEVKQETPDKERKISISDWNDAKIEDADKRKKKEMNERQLRELAAIKQRHLEEAKLREVQELCRLAAEHDASAKAEKDKKTEQKQPKTPDEPSTSDRGRERVTSARNGADSGRWSPIATPCKPPPAEFKTQDTPEEPKVFHHNKKKEQKLPKTPDESSTSDRGRERKTSASRGAESGTWSPIATPCKPPPAEFELQVTPEEPKVFHHDKKKEQKLPKTPDEPSTSDRSRERIASMSRGAESGRWSPIATPSKPPPAEFETQDTPEEPKMSHYDIVQKRRKRKLEQKKKELSKKMDWSVKSGVRKEERKKKKEKRDKRKKDNKDSKKTEEKAAVPSSSTTYRIPKKKKEGEETVAAAAAVAKEPAPVPASPSKVRPSSSRTKVSARRRRFAAAAPSSSSKKKKENRVERAKRRLAAVTERVKEFDRVATIKKMRRLEEWGAEEERWRKAMYESGKWQKNKAINDVPFDRRAELAETNVKRVRTLRRCQSTERLRHSFRRLSAFHSMETMESEADSLASALTEMQIGEKARRERKLREVKKEISEKTDEDEEMGGPRELESSVFDSKMEQFTRETLEMMKTYIPEKTEEETRELAVRAVDTFMTLDFDMLPSLFQWLQLPECITATILRLVRIFSDILNLAEAPEGCKDCCDEGEHRKCRTLITLLMALSEPHRMGDEEEECMLPPNTLYDAMDVSARCQLRALIRGGCTFDDYYDEGGKNAAHKMLEQCNLSDLVWLIERGLDVNSPVMPTKESDLAKDTYDKPWKLVKEFNEKMAFVSQMHSQRLTARSLYWTKGVMNFNLRPLTLVHTMTPHSYYHRFAAVTMCDSERKGFDRDDAVILAVHAVTVRQGRGLRVAKRTKKAVSELRFPYFLIDQAKDDETFVIKETYQCTRAKLTIRNLADPSASDSIELEKIGENGAATAVFKVPKRQAMTLLSARRLTETLIAVTSPPERSVLIAQYFIVPFRSSTGKSTD